MSCVRKLTGDSMNGSESQATSKHAVALQEFRRSSVQVEGLAFGLKGLGLAVRGIRGLEAMMPKSS